MDVKSPYVFRHCGQKGMWIHLTAVELKSQLADLWLTKKFYSYRKKLFLWLVTKFLQRKAKETKGSYCWLKTRYNQLNNSLRKTLHLVSNKIFNEKNHLDRSEWCLHCRTFNKRNLQLNSTKLLQLKLNCTLHMIFKK